MTDDNLSDEDKALFREQMQSVKPLAKSDKIANAKKTPPPRPRKKAQPHPVRMQRDVLHLSDYIREEVQAESLLSWSTPSLPSQRLGELRQGKIPCEARIDLHGLRPDDARKRLSQFILHQAESGKRCLLVIHGKGGYKGAPPVLKNLVNCWLPQFESILAFHSAQAKDGGTGATYVLLKRLKEID